MQYVFTANLWRWAARTDAIWVFVRLPEDLSDEIADIPTPPAGFGSVRVRATCGSSTWTTSIFPESEGSYVLPIKKAVRDKQHLELGDTAEFTVEVL